MKKIDSKIFKFVLKKNHTYTSLFCENVLVLILKNDECGFGIKIHFLQSGEAHIPRKMHVLTILYSTYEE